MTLWKKPLIVVVGDILDVVDPAVDVDVIVGDVLDDVDAVVDVEV